MNRPPRTLSVRSRSAVFFSPDERYHADRCEPLREAVKRGEVTLCSLARGGYPGRPMPADMLPGVSTVGFWDARGTQGWGLDWHRNEGIEFTFLARGKTPFLVDRDRFGLECGSLTITRPWQRHRVGDPLVGPSRLCWLILDVGVRRPNEPWRWPSWLVLSPADLASLTTLLSHNEQPHWSASQDIGACFERIAACVQSSDPSAVQSRLTVHINELMIDVFELLQQNKMPLDSRLVSTRRTVEMFLADLVDRLDHPWGLDEMAESCGLARSRFSEYCQQITNMSPAEYLTHCRIEAAKRALESEPEQSVTSIGLSCGFQTSQYLCHGFSQADRPEPTRVSRAEEQGGSHSLAGLKARPSGAFSLKWRRLAMVPVENLFSSTSLWRKLPSVVTLQTLAGRRAEILALAERYRVGDVRVFGFRRAR